MRISDWSSDVCSSDLLTIVAASELVEAGRMLQNGYVDPQRTVLVASTHREYAVSEKAAMGDGRYPADRVLQAVTALSRQAILFDMAALAARHRTVINTDRKSTRLNSSH